MKFRHVSSWNCIKAFRYIDSQTHSKITVHLAGDFER